MPRRASSDTEPTETEPGVNTVLLMGRVAAEAVQRELPSGDAVVSLRVVVRRAAGGRAGAGSASVVDTIDLACWTAALRRRALSLSAGDVVSVEGALRRRFWRTPGGPASRSEVEVTSLRPSAARRARRSATTDGAAAVSEAQ